MKVKISMDKVSLQSKPKENKIVETRERTASNWTEIELKKLAYLNGRKGHTIIPAHLQGGTKAENCTEMQILALDFDSGCTFSEIKNRCDSRGLNITYAYHTFSSTEEHEKFRVIFVLDVPETDTFIIKVMLNMLIKIFPECDTSCKDLCRMFFGGKELIYYDGDARIALEQVYSAFLESIDSEKHRSERIRSFAKKQKILLLNNNLCMGELKHMDVIFGGKMDSPVIHITAESKNPPFFVAEATLLPGITCKDKKSEKRKIKLTEGGTNCQLYNDFVSGIELSYDEKFTIATNLININGGRKQFLDIIRQVYGEESFSRWELSLIHI